MLSERKWTLNNSLIAGGGGGLVASVVMCPLDVLKTKLQAQATRQGNPTNKGVRSTIKYIIKTDGFRGLYRGLGPTVLGHLPNWAIYFFVYDSVKAHYANMASNVSDSAPHAKGLHGIFFREHPLLLHVLSAVTAGTSCAISTNPLWVIKTRFQTQTSSERRYRHTLDAARTIYQTEGISAFYRGLFPSLLGVLHVVVQFPLYEEFKIWMKGNNSEPLTSFQLLGCSSVAKFFASLVTYPHEVLRTRLQIQRRPLETYNHASPQNAKLDTLVNKAPRQTEQPSSQKTSLIRVAKSIVRKEGWRALYKGFSVNLIRTVPNSAVTLLTYELIMRHLAGRSA